MESSRVEVDGIVLCLDDGTFRVRLDVRLCRGDRTLERIRRTYKTPFESEEMATLALQKKMEEAQAVIHESRSSASWSTGIINMESTDADTQIV